MPGNWQIGEDFAGRSCAIVDEFYGGRVRAATVGARSLVDAIAAGSPARGLPSSR